MSTKRRILVVTGSRAEFGLLRPVMYAVQRHPELELIVVAAGSHLIQPALTLRDVKAEFAIADSVPMQIVGKTGRYEDAEALGRGVGRFARVFLAMNPDWVVVLGDRIEAFVRKTDRALLEVVHRQGGKVVQHLVVDKLEAGLALTAGTFRVDGRGQRVFRDIPVHAPITRLGGR